MSIQSLLTRFAPVAPAPAPAARPAAGPAAKPPAVAGDTLAIGRKAAATPAGRAAARLIESYERTPWSAPADKLRMLSAIAATRTPAAADVVKEAYQTQLHALGPTYQEALALRFRPLLELPTTPGLAPLPEAKRRELVAFLADELAHGNQPGHVRNGLGVALAVSQTEAGTDALIAEYQATPADRRTRVLTLMGICATEKLVGFLADELDRTTNADQRRDLQLTLQELLARPLR